MIAWLLRIGVFGTFLGHGIFAIQVNPAWIPLLTSVGFSQSSAMQLMPVIGSMDLVIALSVLVKPLQPILAWATIWCFLTALSRIIAGQSIFEFFERFANIFCPAALWLGNLYSERNVPVRPKENNGLLSVFKNNIRALYRS